MKWFVVMALGVLTTGAGPRPSERVDGRAGGDARGALTPERPRPMTWDTPCGACAFTLSSNYLDAPLDMDARGGFQIHDMQLTLLDGSGATVSKADLSPTSARAGQDISQTVTMTTTGATRAVFSYTGSDTVIYSQDIALR